MTPTLIHTIKGDVLIRTATLADVDNYRALRLEALQNHPTVFGQSYEVIAAQPYSYWVERLQPDPSLSLFFAEYEGSVIGMTGIVRSAAPKIKHSATIWGVYVNATWRGQRIAEAMIRACLDWARANGVTIAKLAVVSANQPAIRCYERCGFTTYGVEPQVIFYDGSYYDEYLMACPVDKT
ncbi:MAG: GNAT family N-acetyltransferase [Chloroflexi bacterium]|nr:GNAT family N-acetyltransferase [Chloroflexota bacterium]